jgi:hypothetical protein
MINTQRFSDALKMAEPGSWNVAQVYGYRELGYFSPMYV